MRSDEVSLFMFRSEATLWHSKKSHHQFDAPFIDERTRVARLEFESWSDGFHVSQFYAHGNFTLRGPVALS
jgi:hypothetical protein